MNEDLRVTQEKPRQHREVNTMLRTLSALLTALTIVAVPTVATADEPVAPTVSAGKIVDFSGNCTTLVFYPTGEITGFEIYLEDTLLAARDSGTMPTSFDIRPEIVGAVGHTTTFTTARSGGHISPGTWTVTVTGPGGTASRSVECGDLEYEQALNTAPAAVPEPEIVRPEPRESGSAEHISERAPVAAITIRHGYAPRAV